MRKLLGFIAGFALAFYGLAQVFASSRAMPRGPLWLALCIGAGLIGASLATRPKQHLTDAQRVLQPVTRPWWTLDKRLRLVIIASIVWMAGAYLIQDWYERDLRLVFVPAFAALALHFLVRSTVDRTGHQFDNGSSHRNAAPSLPKTDDIYDAIAQELESGNLDKGLWIRLFAECDGNEAETKVHYIKERATKLSAWQQSDFTHDQRFDEPSTMTKKPVAPASTIEQSPRERELAMEEMIKRMR